MIDFVSDTDPGSVGARKTWLRTGAGLATFALFVRNKANNGWLAAGIADTSQRTDYSTAINAFDTAGNLRANLQVTVDGRIALQTLDAQGVARASLVVDDSGGNPVGVTLTSGESAWSVVTGPNDPRLTGQQAPLGSLFVMADGSWLRKVGPLATEWQPVA